MIRVMSLKEYKKCGGEENLNEGVLPIKLSSWNEFYTTIQRIVGLGDFIWRGHECENWLLESSFDREFKKTEKKNGRGKLKEDHLEEFKNRKQAE